MTPQAASATYSYITYANAYSTVTTREAPASHDDAGRIDVLRWAAAKLAAAWQAHSAQSARAAALRQAAREASRISALAGQIESVYPNMAAELRAAAAHHAGQFD
jgi:hypothetical protein